MLGLSLGKAILYHRAERVNNAQQMAFIIHLQHTVVLVLAHDRLYLCDCRFGSNHLGLCRHDVAHIQDKTVSSRLTPSGSRTLHGVRAVHNDAVGLELHQGDVAAIRQTSRSLAESITHDRL